jgi:acyl carrier protein
MKMIALTSTIENELDAEVTIHEVMKMKTFGELVERVEEEMDE